MSSDNGVLLTKGLNGRFPAAKALNGSTQPAANGRVDEQLPDSEQVAAIWQQRAAELAVPLYAESEGATLDLLIFCLDGKRYGVKVNHVREIYPSRQITAVPRVPEFVVGLFSARGQLLSIIDLHAFLGLPKVTPTSDSKIIVITSDDRTLGSNEQIELGLLADEVEDVITIFVDDLTTVASSLTDSQADFTLGVTAEMLVVLNLEVLLKNKRLIVHEEI